MYVEVRTGNYGYSIYNRSTKKKAQYRKLGIFEFAHKLLQPLT